MISQGVGAVIADLSMAAPEGDVGMPDLGTTQYSAPELLANTEYDDRIDIYSLGVIFYKISVGRIAWRGLFASVVSEPANAEARWREWWVR